MRQNFELLSLAADCWQQWSAFREDRARNKRYTYGRQWDDPVNVDGRIIPEEQYIREQGSIPLKNNLIRRLVRNILGVYRNSRATPTCVARDPREKPFATLMDRLLEYNMERNRLEELYARSMEEFLISGFVVHRKWHGSMRGVTDCWTDYVQPDRFFMDTSTRDFRGWDISLIGEIHDIPFRQLCAVFARSADDCRLLSEIFSVAPEDAFATAAGHFGATRRSDRSFFMPDSPGMCRVAEIWRRESHPSYRCHDTASGQLFIIPEKDFHHAVECENRRRRKAAGNREPRLIKAYWFVREKWRYYHLAPSGHILAEGDSPYHGATHPYVFKAYPFIDGEIHSFVADVIDQQRYTNRLITLYDWVMRSSAKGVLLFPEDAIPDGMDINGVADEWSRFNGVIPFRAKAGMPLPQQVSGNSANMAISDLLGIQLKMFEDVSGISGVLQGRVENGSVSGTLYDQQTRNALISLRDLLDSFNSFVTDCAVKDAENIRLFYPREKILAITGTDPELLSTGAGNFYDTEIDFSIRR